MKLLGYCPECRIGVTKPELGRACAKCGTLLILAELSPHAPTPVDIQTGRDLFLRDYRKMTKGIKNGGITGHRPGASTHARRRLQPTPEAF